jgi:predicted unusual protein kinase regulating ubiquinone biosynthesis (AarF/ABC1/UbiB family)
MTLAPRHLPRLAATVGLFTRYGLADFARDQGLDAIAGGSPGANGKDPASAGTAEAFRRRLVELGPAYVKLGQVLATRSDLLPPEYIRELEKLQDDVEPVPFTDVAAIIEEELGARIGKLFRHLEEEPLGSASLGQAHAAVLRDGREVVVKVQRPNIRDLLAEDVEFFRELARFLTSHSSAARRVDMLGIIAQLERALADELDYRIEARNAAHFRRSLAEFPRLLTPRVVESYSSARVLTTERIRGTKIGDIPPVIRTELDLEPLAGDLTRAYLKQIAVDGHFHADPHPGNVFLILPDVVNPPTPSEIATYGDGDEDGAERPGESRLARAEREAIQAAPVEPPGVDVKLALIDFGMTAHLSPTTRELCLRLLFGLADDRGDDVAEALIELGEPLEAFDRGGFLRDVNGLVGHAYRSDVGELDAGELLNKVITTSLTHGLRLPAELTLLAKALVHLGVVTRALHPAFEPALSIRDYLREIATQRARSRLNPRQMYRVLSETADLLTALPHRVDLITRRIANNELQAKLDLPQLTSLLEGLQKVANRIFSGLVLAALIVASAMLLPERRVLGTAGFVIAGALALYMVGTILLSDRRRRE